MAGEAGVRRGCSPAMLGTHGKSEPGDDDRNCGEALHDDILRLFDFAGMRLSQSLTEFHW
jgi:hypothetical protein